MTYTFKDAYFEEIEHTADIGLKSHAPTMPQLYANMAFGMYHLVLTTEPGKQTKSRNVTATGHSLEELLVNWLSELNYLLSMHHFIASSFSDLSIAPTHSGYILKATLHGWEVRDYKKEIGTEIKAVTYHQLSVETCKTGYRAQVIFDI
jgi:SHS2 domain-containing protein